MANSEVSQFIDLESIKKGASIAVPFVLGTTSLLLLAVPALAVLLTICPVLPIMAIVFACVGLTIFGAGCLYNNPGSYSGPRENAQKCFAVAMLGDAFLALGAIVLFTTVGSALLIPPVAGAVLMGVGAFLLLFAAIAYIDSQKGRVITSCIEEVGNQIFRIFSSERFDKDETKPQWLND